MCQGYNALIFLNLSPLCATTVTERLPAQKSAQNGKNISTKVSEWKMSERVVKELNGEQCIFSSGTIPLKHEYV